MRLFSKPMRAAAAALFLLTGAAAALTAARPFRPKPVVIAYVGGFRGLIPDPASIAVEKLTHINYAFVDVQRGEAWLTNIATDTINFRQLNALKSRNPDLKILISIGGWSWSENFSDAVLTDAGRKLFAHTAVDIIRKYGLDGVDIDWEYPGVAGEEGNVFRPEDKRNYTLMFQAIRASLDTLEKETGVKKLLTTAVGGGKYFVEHTEMAEAAKYLDFVNIMSYDYKTDPNGIAGHHTNLYGSTDNPEESSAHRSVGLFLDAGVPAEKIVMGIAFYGRGWKVGGDTARGLNRMATGGYRGGGYSFIKDSLPAKGFERHWDKRAKAPYLWHPGQQVFISFDDERSVKEKCRYVKKNDLAGVMFWEYSSDPKGYLLDAINKAF
ncbi:glycoside hydrolase family 18 protein [Chitinophaga rhizosphaerae]|uniref:glycoside hydrolase family 18 protein n=1 Tax=Chitinophaga rhizosphaerae TaxID=1864947 RepID=UPI00196B4183|nr:glycoside hydrolase family 18 protein [Chitinophaga rhizosphaerae]